MMKLNVEKTLKANMQKWHCCSAISRWHCHEHQRDKMVELIKREVAKEIFKIEQRKGVKRFQFEQEQKRRKKMKEEQEEMEEMAM